MLADLYRIGLYTTSIILKECCEAIIEKLRLLVSIKSTLAWIKQIAKEFEALHYIPFILRVIDWSHIPIVSPPIDPRSNYCHKDFYSTLLQGFVNARWVNFGITIMDGLDKSMIGDYFRNLR